MTDKPTLHDIPERVARGVALLDEKQPGWDRRIALALLDINDCTECVIGQLFMDDEASHATSPFEVGAKALVGMDDYGYDTNAPALIAYGFSVPRSDDDTEVDALTAEWKRFIRERRATTSIPSGGA